MITALLIIAGYIVGAGIIAGAWEERHDYKEPWYENVMGTILVVMWGFILPILLLYIMGRFIIFIPFYCIDVYRDYKRRRRN